MFCQKQNSYRGIILFEFFTNRFAKFLILSFIFLFYAFLADSIFAKPLVKIGPMVIKNIRPGPDNDGIKSIIIDYDLDKSVYDGPTYVKINSILNENIDRTEFGMSIGISGRSKVFPQRIFIVNRIPNRNDAHTSIKLKISVYDNAQPPKYKAAEIVNFKIDWPEIGSISFTKKSDDELFLKARKIIDDMYKKRIYISVGRNDWIISGTPKSAKERLELIIDRNPEYVKAYLELVRYYIFMDGFKNIGQLERLVDAALVEDDKYADSYIYRGLLYNIQKKFKQSENAFNTAEKLGTKNQWLTINRADMYMGLGKTNKAIREYKKVIALKRKNNRDDAPIEHSYRLLVKILASKDRWQDGNRIHEKRIQAFPEYSCFLAEYANHLLLFSQDHDKALNLAKKAKRLQCKRHDLMESALAMAHIMKWYDLRSNNPIEAQKYFNRAQASIKNMSGFITALVFTEKTQKVLKKLVETKNINIDSRGKNDETALLTYIQLGDVKKVTVLLKLGANPNSKHFKQDITPVMLAIFQQDLNILIQLLNYGGNPNSKDKKGNSALDYAKKIMKKNAIDELIKHGAV